MKRILVPAVILALAALAVTISILRGGDDLDGRFLGYVEAETTLVGPKTAGRVTSIAVRRGDTVTGGQALFSLDAEAQRSRVDEAKAGLDNALAQLEDRKAAQQRPEQIAVLEATRKRAKAAVELSEAEYRRQKELFDKGVISRSEFDTVRAAKDRDEAALAEVERQIRAARLGSREGMIQSAEAAVEAAKATLAQAQSALDDASVSAPEDGRVMDVFFHEGEVVTAGQPVVEILSPEYLDVRFYVPETSVAGIHLGDEVAVSCDGCPDDLRAKVVFVSPDAEYTPPVLFTREARSKLVFQVRAHPIGEALELLKPGLPVEVALSSDGARG
ncbi:MAG: HlyD family efflux transporter periplasmic adaptor subunit [Deltaproteobacteria bacterium]|nr:HlyD family efflux transporter periplasmic adaptor subunit [Deltaproteobacteria bacterium]MCB9478716.1 HlyD family efflux transporter periplasmic adaptor subunit [Deltaproteobacteria bacterium]MCB9488232.1 HlyD family efflux transporter periplasmic adaptor subunit [Deltaproteobacteria bacterium]